MFTDELETLSKARGARLHYLFGRRSALRRDPLDARNLRSIVPDIAAREIYVCGPEGMIRTVRESSSSAPDSRVPDPRGAICVLTSADRRPHPRLVDARPPGRSRRDGRSSRSSRPRSAWSSSSASRRRTRRPSGIGRHLLPSACPERAAAGRRMPARLSPRAPPARPRRPPGPGKSTVTSSEPASAMSRSD